MNNNAVDYWALSKQLAVTLRFVVWQNMVSDNPLWDKRGEFQKEVEELLSKIDTEDYTAEGDATELYVSLTVNQNELNAILAKALAEGDAKPDVMPALTVEVREKDAGE